MLISELCSSNKIISIYGLAKNTGKTVTFNTLAKEFSDQGEVVAVTSIGRDGEEFDVIYQSMEKPRIKLVPGMLVATTHCILRRSHVAYDLLEKTPYLTPLGQVVVARILEEGLIEVAGPSISDQIKHVTDLMFLHGATKVLIDGAINRRSASSPTVSEGIFVSTGAALSEDFDEVIRETAEAIQRVKIEVLPDTAIVDRASACNMSFIVTSEESSVYIPDTFGLTNRCMRLKETQAAFGHLTHIVVRGAISEEFLDGLISVNRSRELFVVATDSSKFYLERKSVHWYERQGIHLRVLRSTNLCAITVNPTFLPGYSFDSIALRKQLSAQIPGIAIRDVMDSSYLKANVSSDVDCEDVAC